MAHQLTHEVIDHLPAALTPAERVVLGVVAYHAQLADRRCWMPAEKMQTRTGLSETGLRQAHQRLARRGLECRVAQGVDKAGRPVYAHRGHTTTYQLPDLPAPEGCSCQRGTVTHPRPNDDTPDPGPDGPQNTPQGPPSGPHSVSGLHGTVTAMAAIDTALAAATGCAGCGASLTDSPSEDFCCEPCQDAWLTGRSTDPPVDRQAGRDDRLLETTPIRPLSWLGPPPPAPASPHHGDASPSPSPRNGDARASATPDNGDVEASPSRANGDAGPLPSDRKGDATEPERRRWGVAQYERVETTPGETPAVTTGPPAPAPAPGPPPLPAQQPDGSRCGRGDCRHPAPCGACGRARTAETLAQQRAEATQAHQAAAQRRAAAAGRRAAVSDCPNGCVEGYLGRRVCDHRHLRSPQQTAGYQQIRAILAARAARRAEQAHDHRPGPDVTDLPGPRHDADQATTLRQGA